MRRAVRWGILSGTLAAAVPTSAHADDVPAQREAQARFEEGIGRVKAGNFEGARMSFTQAYAVVKKPTILWNLALAEEKSRHVLDALRHFKEFARGVATDDRAGVDKHVGDLMAQTGHIDLAAPDGAQVLVDGAPVGLAPIRDPVDVLPGHHHVEARTQQPVRDADVEVGAAQMVHVSLMPPAEATNPPAPPPPVVPPAEASAPPRLEAPAPPPAGTEDASELAASSAPRLIAVALIGAATAVSAALGAYYALQSQRDQGTVGGFRHQHPPSFCSQITLETGGTCSAWNSAVQAQARDAMLSNVFYVVGGVLGAGGVATWFLWPTPIVGPTGVGVGAAGRF